MKLMRTGTRWVNDTARSIFAVEVFGNLETEKMAILLSVFSKVLFVCNIRAEDRII